jgi:hypothetical protein
MITRRPVRRLLPLVFFLAPVLLAAEDRIDFGNSSDALLLELNFEGRSVAPRAALEARMAGESYEAPPAMQIFGDGRVVVHRYLVDELRELVLSPQELRQELQQLFTAGIHELREDQLHSEIAARVQEIHRTTGRIRLTTHLATYRLDLQIDGYASEGEAVRPISVHESWETVSVWAEDGNLGNETIERFAAVEGLLSDLHRRVESTGTLIQEEE